MQGDDRSKLPIDDFNEKRSMKNRVKKSLKGECLYCGCSPFLLTVDHVIPLSMGGLTEESNLVPACLDCNRSKGHKDVLTWWESQPFYDEARARLLVS